MPQITEVSAGVYRHSLVGAVLVALTHQSGGDDEQLMLFVKLASGERLRLWFREVEEFELTAERAELPGREVAVMTDESEAPASYEIVDVDGTPLLTFGSGEWSWHPVEEPEVFAFMLNEKQQAAVRSMMQVIVNRDAGAIVGLLGPDADPDEDFWDEAEDEPDVPLDLVMPPGEVSDWEVFGFPRDPAAPDALYLHATVWADYGLSDLTVRFELVPDGDDYRVELELMEVM